MLVTLWNKSHFLADIWFLKNYFVFQVKIEVGNQLLKFSNRVYQKNTVGNLEEVVSWICSLPKQRKGLAAYTSLQGFSSFWSHGKWKRRVWIGKKTKHLSEITIYSYSTYLADIDSQRSSIKTDYTSNYF